MEYIFLIIVLIFSVTIHEVAHGAVANSLGDNTAKEAGRLTLNPLKHLDPLGSVFLPLMLIFLMKITGGKGIVFGWAKPVPINPYNFRDKKYGSAKVALAGPAANFAIALIFGLGIRFLSNSFAFSQFSSLFLCFTFIVYINLLLAVFNLLPIPPLDGSHILFAFLPHSADRFKIFLSQYGFFILIFVIFFLFPYLAVFINWIFRLITGIPF